MDNHNIHQLLADLLPLNTDSQASTTRRFEHPDVARASLKGFAHFMIGVGATWGDFLANTAAAWDAHTFGSAQVCWGADGDLLRARFLPAL